MGISLMLIGIVAFVAIIWIVMEVRKFNHKALEISLIFFILFAYFSFTFVVGSKANLSTLGGIKEAGSLYLSWLGSVFSNLKTLTANAIHLNWGVNHTVSSNASVLNFTNPLQ